MTHPTGSPQRAAQPHVAARPPHARPDRAFVWIWLPGARRPVLAGRLAQSAGALCFAYERSYLERGDAISIYAPELPLRAGWQAPLEGLSAPGAILDARPDAWGQRVVEHRLLGAAALGDLDPGELGALTYLLASGSERIGALDFQASARRYAARERTDASLAELARAAALLDDGQPLPAALADMLLARSAVGGARPKALFDDGARKSIAKFSCASDRYPVMQGEFVAMELARRAGLDVAAVTLRGDRGAPVLLVERFDRGAGGRRRALVSALSILELDELAARWASYADLAAVVRTRFSAPQATLRELFARLAFNILVGNTDDHARNHAAFWDGQQLTLTPAYDICPQPRSGGEASQGMAIVEGYRLSSLAGAVEHAHIFGLSEAQARELIDHQVAVIRAQWREVCEAAGLSGAQREQFWGRQFLNPFAFESYS